MSYLLEKEVEIVDWSQEEKRENRGLTEKKRIGIAISKKTREEASIYYVSVRPLFPLHGNQAGDGRVAKKLALEWSFTTQIKYWDRLRGSPVDC